MKCTKVREIIMQVLNNLDNNLDICDSSVNDIEQPPSNEMNIIAEECLFCSYANTYVETIIGGYRATRPWTVTYSSCGALLECLECIEKIENKLDETNQALPISNR